MPVKIIHNGEGFELVRLSNDGRLEILRDLAEANGEDFQRCLIQAEAILQTRRYQNMGAVVQEWPVPSSTRWPPPATPCLPRPCRRRRIPSRTEGIDSLALWTVERQAATQRRLHTRR